MKRSFLHSAFFYFLILFLTLFACSASVFAAQTTSEPVGLSDLLDRAKEYENTVVQFKGEAIGSILFRGENAWVNVSDANNSALGIYMPSDMAKQISILGHYGTQGDTLLITGTFHRACSEHGGDMDIHAQRIQILSSGKTISATIPKWLPILAICSAIFAFFLCAFAFFRIQCYNKNKKVRREDCSENS